MIISGIPQMEPWLGSEEKDALSQYMEEGGWLTEFKRTAEFEQRIAEYTGAKYCIVVNNGTISLTLMSIAAGITSGDEVIVPNYTMIATPNSIKMIGATPVFVDVEPETLCMDIECARNAITPATKALFIVTANGCAPLIPPIPAVSTNLPLSVSALKTFLASDAKVSYVPCKMPCVPI